MPSSLPLYLRTWRSIFAMQRSIELYMFSVVSWPAIDEPVVELEVDVDAVVVTFGRETT